MELVNAIAKVRFSSARAQRVRLHRSTRSAVEMLCLEPGQEVSLPESTRCYYVVAGSARFHAGKVSIDASPGHVVAPGEGETMSLANAGQQRVICLEF